ncbi:MAG: clan AA aspartic protease [Burkholderiales bacterium]|nr:clan AA aspartic protease [Burkholderiales bacterium]MDE2397776.1 clan AA aspartic protease [Burkholderiales bacterium]MDE2452113.1 clan AA aspartic protease [Burkholderiales bacterium]
MRDFPRPLKHLTVWLLLGTAVFLGVKAWQHRQQQSRFEAAGGAIELRRGADGHFHWPGRVDGVAATFLVDTGATRSALPLALAERAGLVAEGRALTSTAGGDARGWVARADIELDGGVRVRRLQVIVLPALDGPLLGMDLLSKMRFSQRDSVLRFEPEAR